MVNREFGEWTCHVFDEMCSITNPWLALLLQLLLQLKRQASNQ